MTILASSVAFIDMTIVNLALPVMQADLGATFQSMQWVVEAYILLLTAFMLTGGGLADRYGRRRILCVGALLFLAASVAAGLSANATELIVARALQGLGGALLAPASLAIVSSSFPPRERGRAVGLWAAFSGVSTALAPPLGGVLIEMWSWRAVFFINVPILATVLLFAPWRLPESVRCKAGSGAATLDWVGALVACAALGALTLALLRCGQWGIFDPVVIGSAGAAIILLCIFVFVEKRAAAPMVPLEIFAARAFLGLNIMTLVLFTAVGAVMFFLPMTLLQSLQYTPIEAGAALIPSMLVMFAVSPAMGRFSDRYGPRLPLIIGPCISALAYVVFAATASPSYLNGILLPVLLMGLGFGTWVTPLTSSVMTAAGEANAGIASGINNAVARLAQLLAIAVLGLLASVVFNAALDAYLVQTNVSADLVALLADERAKLGGMIAPDGVPHDQMNAIQWAVRTAMRDAFSAVCYVAACLCVCASLIGNWSVAGIRTRVSVSK